jgi:hypothetical protein
MAKCPKCAHVGARATAVRVKPKPPDCCIECACGAYWEGKYAVNNPTIDAHRERERRGNKLGCKVTVVRWNPKPAQEAPK